MDPSSLSAVFHVQREEDKNSKINEKDVQKLEIENTSDANEKFRTKVSSDFMETGTLNTPAKSFGGKVYSINNNNNCLNLKMEKNLKFLSSNNNHTVKINDDLSQGVILSSSENNSKDNFVDPDGLTIQTSPASERDRPIDVSLSLKKEVGYKWLNNSTSLNLDSSTTSASPYSCGSNSTASSSGTQSDGSVINRIPLARRLTDSLSFGDWLSPTPANRMDNQTLELVREEIICLEKFQSSTFKQYQNWKTSKWGEDQLESVALDDEDLDFELNLPTLVYGGPSSGWISCVVDFITETLYARVMATVLLLGDVIFSWSTFIRDPKLLAGHWTQLKAVWCSYSSLLSQIASEHMDACIKSAEQIPLHSCRDKQPKHPRREKRLPSLSSSTSPSPRDSDTLKRHRSIPTQSMADVAVNMRRRFLDDHSERDRMDISDSEKSPKGSLQSVLAVEDDDDDEEVGCGNLWSGCRADEGDDEDQLLELVGSWREYISGLTGSVPNVIGGLEGYGSIGDMKNFVQGKLPFDKLQHLSWRGITSTENEDNNNNNNNHNIINNNNVNNNSDTSDKKEEVDYNNNINKNKNENNINNNNNKNENESFKGEEKMKSSDEEKIVDENFIKRENSGRKDFSDKISALICRKINKENNNKDKKIDNFFISESPILKTTTQKNDECYVQLTVGEMTRTKRCLLAVSNAVISMTLTIGQAVKTVGNCPTRNQHPRVVAQTAN